jgi:hypothetical protein
MFFHPHSSIGTSPLNNAPASWSAVTEMRGRNLASTAPLSSVSKSKRRPASQNTRAKSDLAAWTMPCNQVINLGEVLNKLTPTRQ